MAGEHTSWWKAKKGEVNRLVLDQIAEIETRQSHHFERFLKLEALYDPNGEGSREVENHVVGQVNENVIATNVDTTTAAVATTEIRARFMTDDADWSKQRRARELEWAAEELTKLLDLHAKREHRYRGAAKKGLGAIYYHADMETGELCARVVPADDIVVDDLECVGGRTPRTMHYRQTNADVDELISRFPKKADAIERACGARASTYLWRGPRFAGPAPLVLAESWRLPIGRKGTERYVPGRHTLVIDGEDLVDEPYEEPTFPIVDQRWTPREDSFYGISLAERIAGHQRSLNVSNWQHQRMIMQYAVRTTYVRPADAGLRVQAISPLGTIAVSRAQEYPHTVMPPASHPELNAWRQDLKNSAREESGMTAMQTYGAKPAGIDSGVAMREFKDQTTQRHATQEKDHERAGLADVITVLSLCKKLGDKAPKLMRRSRFGKKTLDLGKVTVDEMRIMIAAASSLSRTPAGRAQLALELAQAGVISTDEYRRLLDHPDLANILSAYQSALESIEADLEAIEDGNVVVPEPYTNLKMAVWRGQMRYLEDRDAGAPEEILEGIRQYVVQAADRLALLEAGPQNVNASDPLAAPDVAVDPLADPAMVDPSLGGTPAPALSPQAMQVLAS